IAIPLVRMEASQKCAKGIHLVDQAKYLDARVEAARKGNGSLDDLGGASPLLFQRAQTELPETCCTLSSTRRLKLRAKLLQLRDLGCGVPATASPAGARNRLLIATLN